MSLECVVTDVGKLPPGRRAGAHVCAVLVSYRFPIGMCKGTKAVQPPPGEQSLPAGDARTPRGGWLEGSVSY